MENYNIEWLCAIQNCSLDSIINSPMASLRLRTGIAAEAISDAGYNTIFSDGYGTNASKKIFVTKIDYSTDHSRPERWRKYLNNAKKNGAKIIIDYTDHHLINETPAGKFYKEIMPLADSIICSSNLLAKHVNSFFNKKTLVIEDPIEINITPPKNQSSEILTGLWFGHASNIKYLIDYLLNNYEEDQKYRLILMSNSYPLHSNYTKTLESQKLNSLEIHTLPWSIENMIEISKISDFCLLPAGTNDPRKSGASSNRLITALALGLPVAADNLESYKPFRNFYTELRSMEFLDLLKNPLSKNKSIESAQKIISAKFTKEAICKDWIEFITTDGNFPLLQGSQK